MVPIEQKDWTEEDRASKLGQNHPLDSAKRHFSCRDDEAAKERVKQLVADYDIELWHLAVC